MNRDLALGVAHTEVTLGRQTEHVGEAVGRFSHAVRLYEKYAPGSLPLAGALLELGRAHAIQQGYASALEILQRARAIVRLSTDGDSLTDAKLSSEIGEVLLRWGRHSDAETELKHSKLVFETWMRSQHPEPLERYLSFVLSQLNRLYLSTGRPFEAAVVNSQLLTLMQHQ